MSFVGIHDNVLVYVLFLHDKLDLLQLASKHLHGWSCRAHKKLVQHTGSIHMITSYHITARTASFFCWASRMNAVSSVKCYSVYIRHDRWVPSAALHSLAVAPAHNLLYLFCCSDIVAPSAALHSLAVALAQNLLILTIWHSHN